MICQAILHSRTVYPCAIVPFLFGQREHTELVVDVEAACEVEHKAERVIGIVILYSLSTIVLIFQYLPQLSQVQMSIAQLCGVGISLVRRQSAIGVL